MPWYVWLALIAVGMLLLDRLFLFLEERGYIYWRKKKSSVSGVSAFLAIDVAVNPGKQYLIEQLQEEKKECSDEEDGEGDKKP